MKNNQTTFLKLCLSDALIKLIEEKSYDDISVNEICKTADVGRTTFYRYFPNKYSKEELISFKLTYEWESYQEINKELITKDKGIAFINFCYEKKNLFTLLYKNKLILPIMSTFEALIIENSSKSKADSYMNAFMSYGWFGAIYQWIKYDFDETPDQIINHIYSSIISGATKQ